MPPEHYPDARGATTPDAVQDLLRFISETQAALDHPPSGPADEALAACSRSALQSLLERAQEQLAEADAFRHYVDAMADPVVRLDATLRVLYLNSAAERALGVGCAQCRGSALAELPLPRPAVAELRATCERTLQDGVERSCLLKHALAPDGKAHHVEYHLVPEAAGGGSPRSVLVSMHDVTERVQQDERLRREAESLEQDMQERLSELAWTNLALQAEISQRRRAERELQSAEHRLSMVGRAAGVGVWHWTPETETLTLDDTARELAGLPVGAPTTLEALLDRTHPEDRPALAEAACYEGQHEGFEEVTFRVARPGNGWRWLLVRGQDAGAAAVDEDGAPLGIEARRRAGIVLDVTEQRAAEEALRESERRANEVLDSSVDFVFRIDVRTERFDYVSPSVQAILGYAPDDVLRLCVQDLEQIIHPDDRAAWREVVEEARRGLSRGATLYTEHRWRTRHIGYRWLAVQYHPIVSGEGEPTALVGVARDVTEQKAARAEIERRMVQTAALYEASQVLLSEFEPQRVLERVCELAVERFGLHMAWAGLVPLHPSNGATTLGPLVHARADEAFMGIVRGRLRGERTEQFQSLVRDGVPLIHQRLDEPGDVVPREIAAAAVARGCASVALLPIPSGEHPGDARTAGVLAVYAATPDAMDERMVQALGSLANLASLGLQRARLYRAVADHARRLEADVAQRSEDLRTSEARFQAIFQNAAVGITMADLDGRLLEMNSAFCALFGAEPDDLRGRLFTELIVHEDMSEELVDSLWDMVREDRPPVHLEIRFLRMDGQARWGSVTVSIVRDARGEPSFAIGMLQDITEEKEAHVALVQAQRLSVTGQLAAALTHEVKNPLQSVIGCLGLIDDSLSRGSNARLYLQVARQELHRADRILNRLRELNRKVQTEQAIYANIMDLLRRVLIVTERQRETQGIVLDLEAPDDLPTIPVAPDQIEQVLLNLVLNAIEAMPDGGTLAIVIEPTDDPAWIVVSVIDSGTGIPSDVLPHIFDALFTTKARGTGMGLFVTRDIIRQHNGWIEVRSEPPYGTRFDFWLPGGEA